MARLWQLSVVVIVLTLAPMHAGADSAWVLWTAAPVASDQWSIASVPKSRFTAKDECDQHADRLILRRPWRKMERITGDSRDLFTCLLDDVDSRPEGVLR
jgi:hypothetical protein